jgi:uncharacterized protein YdhG (YjbR/CyaY superfamily)
MNQRKIVFYTIDDCIETFPDEIRKILTDLRQIIKAAAPSAKEKISYNMPAFTQNGILVYFAAYKNHIGFYPTASGIISFKKEIGIYKWSKRVIQFPINEPIPTDLVTKIVKFRVKENSAKEKKSKLTLLYLLLLIQNKNYYYFHY